jgi:RimJ/RimL family protein N-acetyltransferase
MSASMSSFPANWPTPLTAVKLHGHIVQLEPLAVGDEPNLVQICQDERIWRYLTSYGGTHEAMRRYLEGAMRDYLSGSALPFVIRARSNQDVIGTTRLKNISREHRNAVVGSWLAASAWGSGANTESKLLLLTHAFETLNCVRIEFHADSRNLRSRTALEKIGAHEEGILRSCHITRDGLLRDTVVFSILDREWPEAKVKLLSRLETQEARSRNKNCGAEPANGEIGA